MSRCVDPISRADSRGADAMTPIHAQNVEATTGFEPVNRGFADLHTTLATRETALFRTLSAYSGPFGSVERSVDHGWNVQRPESAEAAA